MLSGQHLLITCDEGYDVCGDSSVLCESGVYQLTAQPSCHRISCGSLQVVHGRAVPSTNILFGDTARVECNAGYFLNQQSAGIQMHEECTAYGLPPSSYLLLCFNHVDSRWDVVVVTVCLCSNLSHIALFLLSSLWSSLSMVLSLFFPFLRALFPDFFSLSLSLSHTRTHTTLLSCSPSVCLFRRDTHALSLTIFLARMRARSVSLCLSQAHFLRHGNVSTVPCFLHHQSEAPQNQTVAAPQVTIRKQVLMPAPGIWSVSVVRTRATMKRVFYARKENTRQKLQQSLVWIVLATHFLLKEVSLCQIALAISDTFWCKSWKVVLLRQLVFVMLDFSHQRMDHHVYLVPKDFTNEMLD